MTRYQVTVRGNGVELRGYVDNNPAGIARAMKPFGVVVASEVDDGYDPFTDVERLIEAASSKERLMAAMSVFEQAMTAMPEEYRGTKQSQMLWVDAYRAAHIRLQGSQREEA